MPRQQCNHIYAIRIKIFIELVYVKERRTKNNFIFFILTQYV